MKRFQTYIFAVLFVFIILYGSYVRIHGAIERNGFSGGDAFNFLNASRALTNLQYPRDERRLPFFPFILIPVANAPLIALEYSKGISVISGIATIFMAALLTYSLTKKKYLAVVAAFLIAIHTVLVVTSIRALADSLFTFLTTTSLFVTYLFYRDKGKKTVRLPVLLGVILGITSLTRFEGMLLAGSILGILFLSPTHRKKTIIAGIAFACCMIPWFLRNFFLFGNPFFTTYLNESASGYGAASWSILKDRMYQGYLNLLNVYFPWNIYEIKSAIITVVTPHLDAKGKVQYFVEAFPRLSLTALGLFSMAFLLTGMYVLIKKWKWYGIAFLCGVFSLYLLANWWTPRTRFYASQIPLFTVILSLGLGYLFDLLPKKKIYLKVGAVLLLMILFYLLFIFYDKSNFDRIKAEHHDTQDTHMFITSLKYLHTHDKKTFAVVENGIEIVLFYHQNTMAIAKLSDIDTHTCKKNECVVYIISDTMQKEIKTKKYRLSLLKEFYQPLQKKHIIIYTIR